MIEACHTIQLQKLNSTGNKDARFIIPVVPGMKREDLREKLLEFIRSNDVVLKAALRRMSERVSRYSFCFRDEPDKVSPSLNGMTLCEEFVYLHGIDFASANIPQKQYLDAIRICLEDHSL